MTSFSTNFIDTATLSENGNSKPRFLSTPQWIDKTNHHHPNINNRNNSWENNQETATGRTRSTTAMAAAASASDQKREISLDGYYDVNRRPVSTGAAGATSAAAVGMLINKSEANHRSSQQTYNNSKRIKSSGNEHSLITPHSPPPPLQKSIPSSNKRSSTNSSSSHRSPRPRRPTSDNMSQAGGRGQEVVIGKDLRQAIKQLLSVPTFDYDNNDEVQEEQDMVDIMNNDLSNNINSNNNNNSSNRLPLVVGREEGASDSVFYEREPNCMGNEDAMMMTHRGVSIAVTVNDNGDSKTCAVNVISEPDDDVKVKVNRMSPGRVSEGWNIIHECNVGVVPSERYNSLSKSKEFWPQRVENVTKTFLLPAANQTEKSSIQNAKSEDTVFVTYPFKNEDRSSKQEFLSQHGDVVTKTVVSLPAATQIENSTIRNVDNVNDKPNPFKNSLHNEEYLSQCVQNVSKTVLVPAAKQMEKSTIQNVENINDRPNPFKNEFANEEFKSHRFGDVTKTVALPTVNQTEKFTIQKAKTANSNITSNFAPQNIELVKNTNCLRAVSEIENSIIQNAKSVNNTQAKFELTNDNLSLESIDNITKTAAFSASNEIATSTIQDISNVNSNPLKVELINVELDHHGQVVSGERPMKKDCSLNFKVNKVQKHSLAPKLVNLEPAAIETGNLASTHIEPENSKRLAKNANSISATLTNETFNSMRSSLESGNNCATPIAESGDFESSSDINNEISKRQVFDDIDKSDESKMKKDNEVMEKCLVKMSENVLTSDDRSHLPNSIVNKNKILREMYFNDTSINNQIFELQGNQALDLAQTEYLNNSQNERVAEISFEAKCMDNYLLSPASNQFHSNPEIHTTVIDSTSANVRNISTFEDCLMQPESHNYEVLHFNSEKSPEELFDEIMESLRDDAFSKIKAYSPKASAAFDDNVEKNEQTQKCDVPIIESLETVDKVQLQQKTYNVEQCTVTYISQEENQSDIERNVSIPEKQITLEEHSESLPQPFPVSGELENRSGRQSNDSSRERGSCEYQRSGRSFHHSSRLQNSSGCNSDIYSDELDLDLENEFRTNLDACSNSDSGNLDDLVDPDDDDLFWESADSHAKESPGILVVMTSVDESSTGRTSGDVETSSNVKSLTSHDDQPRLSVVTVQNMAPYKCDDVMAINDVTVMSNEFNTGVTSLDCNTTKTVNKNNTDSLNVTTVQCSLIEPVGNFLSVERKNNASVQSTSMLSQDKKIVIAVKSVERPIAFNDQEVQAVSQDNSSRSSITNIASVDFNNKTLADENLLANDNNEVFEDTELPKKNNQNDPDDSMERIVVDNLNISSNNQRFSTIPQMSFNAIYESNMSNILENSDFDQHADHADHVSNFIEIDRVGKSVEYKNETDLDDLDLESMVYNDNIPDSFKMQTGARFAISEDSFKTKNDISIINNDRQVARENNLIADKANEKSIVVNQDSITPNAENKTDNTESITASESNLTANKDSLISKRDILAENDVSVIDSKDYLVEANESKLIANEELLLYKIDRLRVNTEGLAAENDSMIVNIDSSTASLTSSSSNSSQSLVESTTKQALNDHRANVVSTTGTIVLSDEVTTQEVVLAISWPNRKRSSFSGSQSHRKARAPNNSVEDKQPFRQLNVHRVIRMSDFDRDKSKRSRSSSVDSNGRLQSSRYTDDLSSSVINTPSSDENDVQSKQLIHNSQNTRNDSFEQKSCTVSNLKLLPKSVISNMARVDPDATSSRTAEQEENDEVYHVPIDAVYSVPPLNDVIDEITEVIRSEDKHSLNEAGILMTCRATESRSFPVTFGSMQESSIVNVIRRSILERKNSQSSN